MEHRTQNRKKEGKSRALCARPFPHAACSMIHAPCQKGFALLFAVLASSVFLSIGIAIWNISLRQVLFSSFGRESQVAFYAADAGIECALFYDTKHDYFNPDDPATVMNCGGGDVMIDPDANPVFTISDIRLTDSDTGPCVDVTVTKDLITTVEARGHNTCDTLSPTRVERGLRVTY
ncbi:MAG: pilus assembly PilX N-terminal domain-containing protein [Patescibacteria group bacterium]